MTPALRKSLVAVFVAILAAIGVWLGGGEDSAPLSNDDDSAVHDDDDSAGDDDDSAGGDDDDSGQTTEP